MPGNPKKFTDEVKLDLLKDLQHNLVVANLKGMDIYQIDESLFSAQDYLKRAWSLPNDNVKLLQVSAHLKKVAVMGAISAKTGKFIKMYKASYFNQKDTINFVKKILRHHKNRASRVCLFWDNASVHKGEQISDFLWEKNIMKIQNIQYEPELMGLETIWGTIKKIYRDKLTCFKLDKLVFNAEEVIDEIIESFTRSQVKKYAMHGWRNCLLDPRHPRRNIKRF